MNTWRIMVGDVREQLDLLPAESVQCVVTSPPYWGLRDYGAEGQLGLEPTPDAYVAAMVEVFAAARRVLREDGTLWLNLGDSYAVSHHGKGGASKSEAFNDPGEAWREGVVNERRERGVPYGLKPKDLVGIPWRVAFALQADGWWLRSDIIWAKPNPMPESVTDRPTKAHEYLFLLTKSARYYYDAEAIAEKATDYVARTVGRGVDVGGKHDRTRPNGNVAAPGGKRNKRTVWTIPTQPFPGAHFAVFPPALVEPCVKAGTSEKGCCAACGAPITRIVRTNNPSKAANTGRDMSGGAAKTGNPQTSAGLHRQKGGVYSTAETLGWERSCDHDGDSVPCTVLDPFAGSGTTLLVANDHQRDSVGIELNPEYAEMARKRLQQRNPLFAQEFGA